MRNEKLFGLVRKKPCSVCGTLPSDPAHVKTWKASRCDEAFNVIPLCRTHHTQQHAWGWKKFLNRNQRVRDLLIELGWEIEEYSHRLVMTHPEIRKRLESERE